MDKRPDLFERFVPGEEDRALIDEIRRDRSRLQLTEPIACRKMVPEDMEAVMLIVRQSRNMLKKHRVDLWQDGYPNEKAFSIDMERGEAFVMTHGEQIAGIFSLSMRPDPHYAALTDGKWRQEVPYAVLHRSAVGAEYRGTGMADRLIAAAEKIAREAGFTDLRADTHRHNEPMKALLKRCGFQYRGNILVTVGEDHDNRRLAFEKVLK